MRRYTGSPPPNKPTVQDYQQGLKYLIQQSGGKALAQQLGCSVETIRRLNHGDGTVDTIEALCAANDLTTDELLLMSEDGIRAWDSLRNHAAEINGRFYNTFNVDCEQTYVLSNGTILDEHLPGELLKEQYWHRLGRQRPSTTVEIEDDRTLYETTGRVLHFVEQWRESCERQRCLISDAVPIRTVEMIDLQGMHELARRQNEFSWLERQGVEEIIGNMLRKLLSCSYRIVVYDWKKIPPLYQRKINRNHFVTLVVTRNEKREKTFSAQLNREATLSMQWSDNQILASDDWELCRAIERCAIPGLNYQWSKRQAIEFLENLLQESRRV
jgi:hypothetical protein